MLTLALPSRIFVCTEPADMRKSFDGLAALVQQHLDGDPLSGDLFVFRSKRGDRVKLLYWNGDGYALWYKKQGAECPILSLLQNSANVPIIALSGLLELVQWLQGGVPCPRPSQPSLPPRAHRPRWFSIRFGIG